MNTNPRDATVRARFESHLRGPALTTADLRTAIQRREADVVEPGERALVTSLRALLESMGRKTTPLHVRLCHALARTYLDFAARRPGDETSGEVEALARLAREVSRTVRHAELGPPESVAGGGTNSVP
jgi:hypothetical protein